MFVCFCYKNNVLSFCVNLYLLKDDSIAKGVRHKRYEEFAEKAFFVLETFAFDEFLYQSQSQEESKCHATQPF